MKGTWRNIFIVVILIVVLSLLVLTYFSTTAGSNKEFIMSEEEKQETLLTNQIFAVANKILKEKGYKSNFMSIEVENPPESLKIEIIVDQKDFKQIKSGIERAVREGIKTKVGIDIDINLTRKK
jgi:regulatory protein YycI of two-component signal transduction system YycFG